MSTGRGADEPEGRLLQVYPTESYEDTTSIDIVAIHGLGTTTPRTWQAFVGAEDGGQKKIVNWLADSDMLPAAVPSARIFTFGWNSAYYEDAPLVRIMDVADMLLGKIQSNRDQSKSHDRPLVFVASCFGGLVVTKALETANISGSTYRQVLLATAGIVFLASPLQGTRLATALQWKVMIGGILGRSPSPTLLQDLDGSSRSLSETTKRFIKMVEKHPMQMMIKCFWESKETQVLDAVFPRWTTAFFSGTKTILVEQDSACFLHRDEQSLDATHVMMNKFRGPRDANYEFVRDAIKAIVSEAHNVATSQRKDEISKARYHMRLPETVGSYTDRPDLSSQLEKMLHAVREGQELPHALAIRGLGGSGKTQLALRYIETHREMYDAIFWVDGQNPDTSLLSFSHIADVIKLPKQTEQSTNASSIWTSQVVQAVLTWLQSWRGKWLMVMDNVDNSEWGIRNLIPKGLTGAVILTSRLHRAPSLFDKSCQTLEVFKMTAKQATELLLKGRDAVGPPSVDDTATAEEIVKALDHLALAIDLARAVISNSRRPDKALHNYLMSIRTGMDGVLQEEEPKGLRSYEKTVANVWNVSIEAVRHRDPPAVQLLILFSLLQSNVEDELFRLASLGLASLRADTNSSYTLPDWLKDMLVSRVTDEAVTWNPSRYDHAIDTLRSYSLVQPITVDGRWPAISIHGLVQWRAGKEMDHLRSTDWTTAAVGLIRAAAVQQMRAEGPDFRRHLMPYLKVVRAYIADGAAKAEETEDMTWLLARIYLEEGLWNDAEILYIGATSMRKTKLGIDHPDTMSSMANLAAIYQSQGRWGEAETLKVEVMNRRKTKLGIDHPDTLTSMANLAATYHSQGRWDKAETLQVEVMDRMKTKLGIDHPNTMSSMANLAAIYHSQGRWDEAETLKVEVMNWMKTKLGIDHPDTISSMSNLAATYQSQGRWDEAETLEVEVTNRRKTKLGIDHPDTLTSIASLASTYWNQGRWDDAEALELEVIETSKKKLGLDHPDTLTIIANLALTYWNQGRWDDAEALLIEVTETSKKKLGLDHPKTLTVIANLAATYWNQGRWDDAEALFVEVMETRKKKFGLDHRDTLTSMANLAFTLKENGRAFEAIDLMQEASDRTLRKLGKDHPTALERSATLSVWKTAQEDA